MFEYLLGDLIGLIIWFALFGTFPWLRNLMLWGSFTAVSLHTVLFLVWKTFSQFLPLGESFVPAYWNPPELFDLGMRFGLAVEDVLFLFVMGGIVVVAYELLSGKLPLDSKKPHRHWGVLAVFIGVFLVLTLFRMNPIYSWSGASAVAAAYALVRRPALARHALLSGALFTAFYTLFFWLVLGIFPWFVTYWSLGNLTGIVLAGIPLEEYLWAFTFGILWGPLYEYVRHARVR